MHVKLPKRGSTFAEIPGRGSPVARIILHARYDPAVLTVNAVPQTRSPGQSFDLAALTVPSVVAVASNGREHVTLSDGYRRIRIDVITGSVLNGPVMLQYQLQGTKNLEPQILTLRRLIALTRTGDFVKNLFPPDPYAVRIVDALRVHDALEAGASQREIANILFGSDLVNREWSGSSDYLKSRIRRLMRLSRDMAAGKWRHLLR